MGKLRAEPSLNLTTEAEWGESITGARRPGLVSSLASHLNDFGKIPSLP